MEPRLQLKRFLVFFVFFFFFVVVVVFFFFFFFFFFQNFLQRGTTFSEKVNATLSH